MDEMETIFQQNIQWEMYEETMLTSNKNYSNSTEIRKCGNVHFKQNRYVEALASYTTAMVWAKSKRITALAYSGRSAVLAKVGLYQESLVDIERAFYNDYSQEFTHKLAFRRSQVIKKQNSNRKTQVLAYPNYHEQATACDNTSFKIHTDNKFGRHVTTTRDIEISEVVLVDKPYTAVLTQDNYIYCSECLKVCYNLISCDACAKALYCSTYCKFVASKTHKYECCLSDVLDRLKSIKDGLALGLKITLLVLIQFRQNKSHDLEEMIKMEAYTNSLLLRMHFTIAWVSSIIYVLLKKHTDLFNDLEGMEEMFKGLLPLIIQVVHINEVVINRLEPTVEGYEMITYARGLYFLFSVFNHSCYPNAFFYQEGPRLVVRALGTIKKEEQCCISYGQDVITVREVHKDPKNPSEVLSTSQPSGGPPSPCNRSVHKLAVYTNIVTIKDPRNRHVLIKGFAIICVKCIKMGETLEKPLCCYCSNPAVKKLV
ncbi:uncharacterized protein LOC135119447 [Zophobas morio]|uniref:uncharacterized protein LOC135119447 n=1 Tax=Zophobas morio TaxID=2755281 RepID=UPI00308298BC